MKTRFFIILAILAISANSFAATKIGEFFYYGNGEHLVLTYESRIASENYPNMEVANIPSRVGDRTTNEVHEIGDYAFCGCTTLRSVSIPELMLPSGISPHAFDSCPNLTDIKWLSIYSHEYSTKEEAPFYPIRHQISSMYCGTTIPAYLCYEMENLSTLTISDTVYRIGDYAFYGCKRLTSVYIPKNVFQIGDKAFLKCDSIRYFDVSSDNPYFCAVDGVLFNKDTTQLIYCPKSKQGTYVVPSSVKHIANYAFYNCKYLNSIQLPDSLISIGICAFGYCMELISIDIPEKISSIGTLPFGGCSNLTSINIKASIPPSKDSSYGLSDRNHNPLLSIYVPCGSLDAYKNNKEWYFDKSMIKYIPLPYVITVIPSSNGNVDIPTSCSGSILNAIPDDNCHFVQWSDGNTENPRTIELTQDTTFEALFAKNVYEANIHANYAERGNVIGGGSYEYQSEVTISAMPNYGYHFVKWLGFDDPIPQDAITASQAYSIAAALSSGDKTSTQYTIVGYITGTYGTYTNSYYLSDSPNVSGNFIAFKCNSSANIGDRVIIKGYLTNYKGTTPETSSGATLTKVVDVSFQNPLSLTLIQDTIITAEFAKNTYELSAQTSNRTMGDVMGSGTYDYLDTISINAIPVYGYHFDQWNDGNTDNPRLIELTQDSTFEALFVPNSYSLNVICDSTYGTIEGEVGSFEYKTEHTYAVIPNYGYHFAQWSDGNTENPRTITVDGDSTIIAMYANNTYDINGITDTQKGTIQIPDETVYLQEVEITAVPNNGYRFTQWSDGVIDNPRTIVLTNDTTFEALFVITKSGTCGNNNLLNWLYDDKSKTLTISGNGALNENFTYGVEAPTQMNNLIIGNDVTAIGERAFYKMNTIKHLIIGGSVTSIGNYAFAECRKFDDITCYATIVPTINATTFANIGNKQYIYLYVPDGRQRAYLRDTYWGEFDVQVINAETVTTTTTDVDVVPTDNTATITWPSVEGAETYEIEITKDGVVVCTLIFNSNGQLSGIAFSPNRNNTQQAQTTGFKFTVTGLSSNTQYNYSVTSKDSNNTTIDTQTGSFETTGEVATELDNIDTSIHVHKLLHNGQILILRGEKIYTIQGQELK